MFVATLLSNPLFYPIAIVLSVAGWFYYQRVLSPYAGVPGPFWASLTRFWYLNRINAQDMHRYTKMLHKQYGPLVRIAPNEVSVSDPAAMKQIYAVNAGYTKTDFYPTQAPNLSPHGDSFTQLDEKKHTYRRRMISHIFSMSSVMEGEKFIDNATAAYFQVIEEHAQKGEKMEMGHWLHMYAFDIIGELFFGRMFGFIKERRDIGGYMGAVDVILPHAIRLAVLYEWMRPIINVVMYPLSANLRQAIRCFEALGAESKRYVDERIGKPSARPDMLSKLIKVMEEKSPDFDITDVYTEAYTAIFAGSETTATAMRSAIYHLCRNPQYKAKLVAEIDAAQREGKLSEMIAYGEAIKLPYLAAVIKEGMRVQPSIVLTFPRHVPAGGATICGHFFPEGCRVGVNPYVLHYQTSIFGEDAEDFNPDRWFRPDAANMDSYMFQFGSGSRTCIGKNVAMAEIYKFLPKLFREYDVNLADPTKEWKEEGAWFVKQTGVEVKFTRRNVE
ncbi:cytochrome P450 [Sphaerosporella brunnea]|uniref:Cytochrome P450 n=1 Tax=Sphaerosporella brunnea TaxID=1250544 RepID=A0A5J5EYS0_9PEZI|nr:cytochrome P450 [Sphaerosporella brunnea]